jgi:hypothetical protein
VHGGSGDHHSWDAVRPFLEPSVRVITMDRRSSFGDPFARYALEREFEDLAAVAATLGDEVDVLGWSSGALCALGTAPHLTNLRRLLLYEPPWLADHLSALVPLLDRLLAAGDAAGVFETFLRAAVRVPEATIAARRAAPEWPALVERARLIPREMAALAAWRFDPERFRTLAVPVGFLVGGDTPPDHHHRGYIPRLAAVVPTVQVLDIPGQHFAPLAAPADFAQQVLALL